MEPYCNSAPTKHKVPRIGLYFIFWVKLVKDKINFCVAACFFFFFSFLKLCNGFIFGFYVWFIPLSSELH